jgi:hypothetical protein
MATVPSRSVKSDENRVEKVSENDRKNSATDSTHIDERKHAYLAGNKEKRVRSLDTLSESCMHARKPEVLGGAFAKLFSAATSGNYERAASSCSKAW